MFDIGFSEIVVIGVVALIVFGPEDLPKVARIAGRMLGNFRRYVDQVKSELDQEIQASELKQLGQDIKDSAQTIQAGFNEQMHAVEAEWQAAKDEAGDVAHAVAEPAREIATVAHEAQSPVAEEVPEPVVEGPAAEPVAPKRTKAARKPLKTALPVEEPVAVVEAEAAAEANEPVIGEVTVAEGAPSVADVVPSSLIDAEAKPYMAAEEAEPPAVVAVTVAEPVAAPEKDDNQLDLFGMSEPSAISNKA